MTRSAILLHPSITDVANRRQTLDKALRSGNLSVKSLLNYSFVYKDLEDAGAVLGFGQTNAVDPNEANGDYTAATLSTWDEDRDGDTVLPMGISVEHYQYNPLWFFAHQEWQVPVGKATAPDGRLCCFPEENRYRQWCWWDKADPDAVFIKGKVDRGFINSTSIAFVPIQARRKEMSKAHQHEGTPGGWLFERVDETEGSWVGVPSNPFANVERQKWYKSAPQEFQKECRDCYDKCCEWRDIADKEKGHISKRLESCIRACYAQKSTNEGGGCWTGWCPCPTKVEEKAENTNSNTWKVRGLQDGKFYVVDRNNRIVVRIPRNDVGFATKEEAEAPKKPRKKTEG